MRHQGSEEPCQSIRFSERRTAPSLDPRIESHQGFSDAVDWEACGLLYRVPWFSLLDHANQYSSFAVGFSKPRVFAAGGGPVYYVRADHFKKQAWEDHLYTFVTPFWPAYRPEKLKEPQYLGGKNVDYSHEGEWRIPHDFSLELSQVEFVILPDYKHMASFPQPLKDGIGRKKFLLMDVYRTVGRLWPVHNIT